MPDLHQRLHTPGVWAFAENLPATQAAEHAARIEQLGYSALWIPEMMGRDPFAHAAYLATATSSMILATGIANIHHRHPGVMKQAADTVAEQSGGRFLLGIGVSHAMMVEGLRGLDYSKPLAKMRSYLESMKASMYMAVPPAEPTPIVLAALGPKMLALSAELTEGAHPYWTTPEHTAQAREILGADKLLCVEQKVVLSTDAAEARAAGMAGLAMYATLPNYRNNWLRLGYTDDEIDQGAPRFIDAVLAWGDAAAIQRRVQAHYDAGATHVCIQPLATVGDYAIDWAALETLAP